MMLRPQRKTRTYRRERAQDARKLLDRYRREVSDESHLADLGEVAMILANLTAIEAGGRMREEVDALFKAGHAIQKAAL